MKNGLYFDDSRYTIVLNTSCAPSKVPEQLRPLFVYINDPDRIEDEFVQAIEERVQKFNSREWRSKQMTLAHLMENAEERGRKEGEARVKTLMERLMEDNRITDMKKALKDDAFMETLLKEYDL